MLYFLPLYFFFLGLGSPAGSVVSKPAPAPVIAPREPEICRMFGSVYLTSDPKQKNYTRYTVYLEAEDTYADLVVFKENNKLFAETDKRRGPETVELVSSAGRIRRSS